MKTKNIRTLSFALAIMLVLSFFAGYGSFRVVTTRAGTKTFTDVPSGYWAAEQIAQAVEQGITGGYQDGTFKPENPVTYAQYYVFIARAFFPDETAHSLTLKWEGPWYKPYFMALFDSKVAQGTAAYDHWGKDGDFGEIFNNSIPRYDMALVMYKILGYKGGGMPSVDETAAATKMSDWNSMPGKYRVAVSTCYALGLLNGKGGKFDGQSSMTRAQACVVISRLKDYLKDNSTGVPATTTTQTSETTSTTPVSPSQTTTRPTGDTTFAMLNGENVQQMMDRINAATPAYREGYLANGQPITEENLKAAIEEIQESMPEGSPWSADDIFRYEINPFGKWGNNWSWATACNSFGWSVSDAIFGEDAPVVRHQNFDELKIGDVIWAKPSANDDEGHVYFITSNQDEDGYVLTADGNVPEDGKRVVNYGTGVCAKRYTPDNPYTKYSIIYSRY